MNIKLANWNLDTSNRNQIASVKWLFASNPSIISLKEVNKATLDYLLRRKDYEVLYTKDIKTTNGIMYLVLLTNITVVKSTIFNYYNKPIKNLYRSISKYLHVKHDYCNAITITLRTAKQTITISNLHLTWGTSPVIRKRQYENFIKNILNYTLQQIGHFLET